MEGKHGKETDSPELSPSPQKQEARSQGIPVISVVGIFMSSHGRVYCSASIHRCRWANQGQKACFTKQEIHADENRLKGSGGRSECKREREGEREEPVHRGKRKRDVKSSRLTGRHPRFN